MAGTSISGALRLKSAMHYARPRATARLAALFSVRGIALSWAGLVVHRWRGPPNDATLQE